MSRRFDEPSDRPTKAHPCLPELLKELESRGQLAELSQDGSTLRVTHPAAPQLHGLITTEDTPAGQVFRWDNGDSITPAGQVARAADIVIGVMQAVTGTVTTIEGWNVWRDGRNWFASRARPFTEYERLNGDIFEDVEADDEQELQELCAARDVYFAALDATRRRTAARHGAPYPDDTPVGAESVSATAEARP